MAGKKLKISIICITIFVSITTVLNGCAVKSKKVSNLKKDPVKLTFLNGTVEMVDWYNDICRKFNAQHPGIIVEHEYEKEGSNAIKVKFASGEIPDITNQGSQEFIDQGKFEDLTNEEQWWSRMTPGIKQTLADGRSGKNYFVMTNKMYAGLFYNKKVFKELGLEPAATWQSFVDNLRQIKNKRPDIIPFYLGGKDSWILGHTVDFFAQNDIKLNYSTKEIQRIFYENDSAKLKFDAAGGNMETYAEGFSNLYKEGLINKDVLTATYENQLEAIADGKAAVISQGMWALSDIYKRSKNSEDIGFTYFPAMQKDLSPTVISGLDSSYLITSDSKHKAEAKEFLDYLFSVEVQKSYSEVRMAQSNFKDVKVDLSILDSVNKSLDEAVEVEWSNPKPLGFTSDDIGRMVQNLLAGKYKSSSEFAKEFRKKWDSAWEISHAK